MSGGVRLDLTLQEANLVLEALGAMPFVRVYALVDKIQQQAQQQLPGAGGAGPAVSPAETPPETEQ